jgi:hypothetical protein
MRATVTIDDELYRAALAVAGPGTTKSDLNRQALEVFIRVQATKRLSALGGAAPRMLDVMRRRTDVGGR